VRASAICKNTHEVSVPFHAGFRNFFANHFPFGINQSGEAEPSPHIRRHSRKKLEQISQLGAPLKPALRCIAYFISFSQAL
jgi:hypothetical protein